MGSFYNRSVLGGGGGFVIVCISRGEGVDSQLAIILPPSATTCFGSTLCFLSLFIPLSPLPPLPSSHFHTPLLRFSNFPPFVPISDIQSVSCSISMQMVDNGACVSPFDPCPVIIQYVRVTRDVITGFSRSSLSHCWRFTSELRKSG